MSAEVAWSDAIVVAPQAVRDAVQSSPVVNDALADYFARERAGTATTLTIEELLDSLSDL